jgi:hypothetical protein
VSPALEKLNNAPDCCLLGVVAGWFAERQASSSIDFKVARFIAPGTSSVPMINAGARLSLSAIAVSQILRISESTSGLLMSTLMRSISRSTSSAHLRLSLDRNLISLPLVLRGSVCVFPVCALREQRAPHKIALAREWRILFARHAGPDRSEPISARKAPLVAKEFLSHHNDGRKRFCSRSGRFYSREWRFRRILHILYRFSLLRISRLDSVGRPFWARGVAWWT